MKSKQPLRIKSSGGAAAQVLALMDAIYISQRTGRKFVFDYYPFGTGTHWPLEIGALLKKDEFGDIARLSRGHNNETAGLPVGQIIENHPINANTFNIEKLYFQIRKLKLDRIALALRREIPIYGSMKRLNKVNRFTFAISGGFLPVIEKNVFDELHQRFDFAGLKSPFKLDDQTNPQFAVVIHYRLGDKRGKFTNPGVVGADGIMDPKIIFEILSNLNLLDSKVLVLSDEPILAQQLLEEVGISASILLRKRSIWDDLHTMAGAKLFIGTWSQVSELASVCVLNNGGQAFLPSMRQGGDDPLSDVRNVQSYQAKFLDSTHSIYFK
jgi:hypothetical protein